MKNKIVISDQKRAIKGTTESGKIGFVRLKKYKTPSNLRYSFTVVTNQRIGNKTKQHILVYLGSLSIKSHTATQKSFIKFQRMLESKFEGLRLHPLSKIRKRYIKQVNAILDREGILATVSI